MFSSRKIERGTYESIPFRFIASGLHPDHDTLANFRKTFLFELEGLFVQVLLLAAEAGVFKLGNISVDGTKLHADASKSKAVSYKRLGELQEQLRAEVHELLTLGESVDQGEVVLPEGLVIPDEIALREERLANLAKAKTVLEARAQERYAAEKAEKASVLKRVFTPDPFQGEADFFKHTFRTDISLGTVRLHAVQIQILKAPADDNPDDFGHVTSAPIGRLQVEANVCTAMFRGPEVKTARADQGIRTFEDNRPTQGNPLIEPAVHPIDHFDGPLTIVAGWFHDQVFHNFGMVVKLNKRIGIIVRNAAQAELTDLKDWERRKVENLVHGRFTVAL